MDPLGAEHEWRGAGAQVLMSVLGHFLHLPPRTELAGASEGLLGLVQPSQLLP